MTKATITLDDILDAIVFEETEPSHPALTRWVAQYPAHRNALERFFATWALQSVRDDETAVDEATLASRGVSYALDLLHSESSARLIECARHGGRPVGQLAARARLDDSMLQKLDQRRLLEIPSVCFDMVAGALSITVEQVRTMVTGSPLLSAGRSYRSKAKPEPKTESFATAVESSALSDDDKHFWREVLAHEPPKRS